MSTTSSDRSDQLDLTFAAISHRTRRTILARLEREGDLTISGLADPLEIGLPATMKHLDVLRDAGLIAREKTGRVVTIRLKPAGLRAASTWLARYERFWTARLDRLASHVERRPPNPKAKTR